jgi:hypothetical protein
MKFTVTITNPAELAGIAAAREAYNAALPDELEDVLDADNKPTGEKRPIEPKPGTLFNDAEYVQFVLWRAAQSYAKQYQTGGPA